VSRKFTRTLRVPYGHGGQVSARRHGTVEEKDEEGPGKPAPLPVERAFVVQLRASTPAGEEPFAGRAEHIASGAVARFASAESLIAFIKGVLAAEGAVGAESGAAESPKKKRI